jgi:hypothetical protein
VAESASANAAVRASQAIRTSNPGFCSVGDGSVRLPLDLILVILATIGRERLIRPNVSGAWKGAIAASDNRGLSWNGPSELTLYQIGAAITDPLSFTHPQGGRVQVPVVSGKSIYIDSKDRSLATRT